MMVIKSKTWEKPETSVEAAPVASTHGLILVGAEITRFLPTESSRSSCRKRRKLAVSLTLMALQPMPWVPGYSQLTSSVSEPSREHSFASEDGSYSKSNPSRLYFWARPTTLLTKAVRLAALPTFVEKCKEPVQPPTDNIAVTFCTIQIYFSQGC